VKIILDCFNHNDTKNTKFFLSETLWLRALVFLKKKNNGMQYKSATPMQPNRITKAGNKKIKTHNKIYATKNISSHSHIGNTCACIC
jgi:hypothetical protein